MKIRKAIPHPATGEPQHGTVVDVEEADEPTGKFKLTDGTLIKVRLVMSEVIKLDEPGPDGRPQFNFNVQVVTVVHLPDEIVE